MEADGVVGHEYLLQHDNKGDPQYRSDSGTADIFSKTCSKHYGVMQRVAFYPDDIGWGID